VLCVNLVALQVLDSLAGVMGNLAAVGDIGRGATDSGLVLSLVAASQAVAFGFVARRLREINAVRRSQWGRALTAEEELNDIAATMQDPRQCAECLFGPVDSYGCDNLAAHHGEVDASNRGGTISNACPRCGWFARRLSQWQPWDPSLHSLAGEGLLRRRAWSDVVVTLRASSKALIVPLALLQSGQRLGLPPALSAFLALAYLLSWVVANTGLAARGRVRPPRSSGGRGGGEGPGAADCGAARAAELPAIAPSEALANILGAEPPWVFLAPLDTCSVCLDAFSDEACACAGRSDPARALRGCAPPVVALRCGHVLHMACAEAAVAAVAGEGDSAHVRCPLCREPVTLAGAASARLFR